MRSIRSRLLVLLVPVTVFALLGGAVGIESLVRGDLETAFDRQLLLLAQSIGAALQVEVDGSLEFDLEGGDMPEFEESARASFYAVAEEDGSVLYAAAAPPPGLFSENQDSPSYFNELVGGESMRLCLVSLLREPESDEEDTERWLEEHPGQSLPDIEARRFLVAAGRPDGELRNTIVLLRRRLLTGFGLLSIILVAFPLWAVGRALHPLRLLSRQADQVGPERTEVRLEEGAADDEIRSLVTALNSALHRLSSAYDQQKRFTADAAHELRSPLSSIRTQCEVNLRKERSGRELTEVLKSVHRSAVRLGGIVEKLLSLSRLEGAGPATERTGVNLSQSIRESREILAPLAEVRGTKVLLMMPDKIAVTGDKNLLGECLSSILDNAIRYTPPGGEVTVEGGNDPGPWISVIDSGIGIAAEDLEKIFERFYRVDPSRSRGDGGSGLGLSIARAIARLHGAVITVKSRPGEGSSFRIDFGQKLSDTVNPSPEP